ncbi:MAG: hypothetical protein PF482_03455 [Desulfobacteraceae bacterium]|jgi:hypothetical protein|nr:hypothetical protein [Desulfobacteraceae bacterium]
MKCNISQAINNQDGSLMVIALLIMVTLALAGLLVTNDAVMESRVGRNYAIYKQTVSAAEAVGKEFIQAIDTIFENALTAPAAVGVLNGKTWQPEDDYNTTFDFDDADWGTYNLKTSDLEANNIGYLTSVEAIAVLVDQSSSALTPGLGGTPVPEYYSYIIYCRAVHAGAGNSETILMIGYRQEKV